MYICPGDSVPPPTEKSRVLTKILKLLFFLQLVLAGCKFYYSILEGTTEVIACLLLYFAFSQLSYCNCVIYIFFCLMNFFYLIVYFGTSVQNKRKILNNDFDNFYFLMVSLVSVFLYVISIYFAFLSYKEFKGIAFDIINASYSDQGFSLNNNFNVNFTTNNIESRYKGTASMGKRLILFFPNIL